MVDYAVRLGNAQEMSDYSPFFVIECGLIGQRHTVDRVSLLKRFALGAAQFGLPYGIANQSGQVDEKEVRRILRVAQAAGLNTLDTAIAYGASEQVLGQIGVDGWQVVTKLPAIPEQSQDLSAWMQNSLEASLERLRLKRVAGLLLHTPSQLLSGCGRTIYQALIDLKRQGLVDQIGYSLYSPAELDALWARYPVDLVQAPFNVLDRRFRTSGWLARLHANGVAVHARSIFLQGLLLMDPALRPARFRTWATLWQMWDQWLTARQLTPLQACVGFAMTQPEFDRIIVGVDRMEQLQEILVAAEIGPVTPPASLAVEDENLINPSRWNSL